MLSIARLGDTCGRLIDRVVLWEQPGMDGLGDRLLACRAEGPEKNQTTTPSSCLPPALGNGSLHLKYFPTGHHEDKSLSLVTIAPPKVP